MLYDIAVTSGSFSANPVLKEAIQSVCHDARLNVTGQKLEGNALANFLGDSECAIVGLERIDETLLDMCPRLKCIAKFGVGLDNIDQKACRERGVYIGWSGGVNRLSVAEMTLGFMLGLFRNLFVNSQKLKEGVWDKKGGFQLSAKTVGIIGLGNIGKEVVRLLQPFRCRILVNDIIDIQDYCTSYELEFVTKEQLFSQSDLVTIHTPLTDLTHHLVDDRMLSLMKPDAFLINTARGGVVNQEDLKYALNHGLIAGAALDVYEEEPPIDIEFLRIPSLICTPHTGGNAFEAVVAMGMSAINHVKEYYNI